MPAKSGPQVRQSIQLSASAAGSQSVVTEEGQIQNSRLGVEKSIPQNT